MEIKCNLPIVMALGLTTALILTLNTLAIIVITGTKKLHNVTGYLMISLSVADMCVGVSAMIPIVYALFTDVLTHTGCQAMGFVNSVSCFVSILTLVLLTIDRFLAIEYPLKYPRFVNNKLCIISITTTWLFSILIWILPLFGVGSFKYNDEEIACHFDVVKHPSQWITYMVVIFIPSSFIIFACNGRLYVISKKHRNQLQSLSIAPCTSLDVRPATRWHFKAFRTILIIVGAFYITWTPFVVEYCVKAISRRANHIPYWLEIMIYILSLSNSFCNPLIYVSTNSLFRESARKKLCYCCKSRTSKVGDYDLSRMESPVGLNTDSRLKTSNSTLPTLSEALTTDSEVKTNTSTLLTISEVLTTDSEVKTNTSTLLTISEVLTTDSEVKTNTSTLLTISRMPTTESEVKMNTSTLPTISIV